MAVGMRRGKTIPLVLLESMSDQSQRNTIQTTHIGNRRQIDNTANANPAGLHQFVKTRLLIGDGPTQQAGDSLHQLIIVIFLMSQLQELRDGVQVVDVEVHELAAVFQCGDFHVA